MITIDKRPPSTTGDTKKDIKALEDYLAYLVERVNHALTIIQKE